jgi:hypothetical protein
MTTQTPDAALEGGPCDGALAATDGSPLLQIERDGLLHRYVLTSKTRERDGAAHPVYTYDGEIDPNGAQPGAETDRRQV